jgi:osmotically-inducible protein OsmY
VLPDDIEITVGDGLVTWTGEVAGDKLASNLVARVRKIAGVEDVAAMLHVLVDDSGEERSP